MSNRARRTHNNKLKAEVVRRHLSGKEPVSNLCDEFNLQPSVIYGWCKQIFDGLEVAFEATSSKQKPGNTREQELSKRVAYLDARLAKKDNVIAEISEAHVALKKELGGL